jgi:tetratricopeptide (TPR) repeat protein
MGEKLLKALFYFESARDYRRRGDLDEAEHLYRNGLSLEPTAHEMHIELGQVYVEKKEDEKALEEYRKALEFVPDNGMLHHEIGRVYSRRREYRLAVEEFEKAKTRGVTDGYIGIDLGFAYKEIGEYEKALKELDDIPEGRVSEWQVSFLKGENYALLGDYERAEWEFSKALQCDPCNEQTKMQLAILYGQKAEKLKSEGKFDEAVGEYTKAVSCRPEESWLHLGLGKLFVFQGKYEQAIRELDSGLAGNPADGELHYELGMCYVQQQQYDRAVVELENALRLNARNYKTILALGNVYAKRKDCKRETAVVNDVPEQIEKICDTDNKDAVSVPQGQFIQHERNHINNATTECSFKPRLLGFFLGYQCNLKCIMCERVRRNPATLPLAVFEKIEEWIPYAQQIEWEGGEVFLVDYFQSLLTRIGKAYPSIIQNITTNGLLITDEWAEILAHLNVRMHFSIDSVVKKTYESIRNGGSFERLVENLEMMHNKYSKLYADNEYTFSMNCLVMKRNAYELVMIPDFL